MTTPPIGRGALALLAIVALLTPATAPAQIPLEGAADPHWIWSQSADGTKGNVRPVQTRYFRRRFDVKENGSTLALDVAADDAFRLFLDGKEIARGTDWKSPTHAEAKILAGTHVLAAEAKNDAIGPAGLLIRGAVTPLGQVAPVHTDANWKVASQVKGDGWTSTSFDDSTWGTAVDLGPLNTPPWSGIVFSTGIAASQFKVPEGFVVTSVASPEVTGSVIAFAFDDGGLPCVSIEHGPIARLVDANKDGTFDSRKVIAPQMSNCQGFNFIKGKLYAVGIGPDGVGLYRLTDTDADGVFDKSELVRAIEGAVGEHGPHSIQLGPDGSLYFNAGNHAHLKGPIDPKSPASIAYEGELIPHYNDPRGHAVGIMAPGGEIYRSDDDGKTWIRVAQGFRNHYDFAFNRDGELFTFDSDMEWDIGLPWYRPVRINHVIPGAEFGWRNGTAPWPDYFLDSLPGTLNIGRGSPTGVTFYQAHAFPFEYQDNFLVCDWSQGRILAIQLEKTGGTYAAKEKPLVTGQPLNVTDIEVGPDGAVYFTTGGRQTLGGLYRVGYSGKLKPYDPPKVPYFFEAMGLDSPHSAFSRAKLAQLKAANPAWGHDLANLAASDRNPPEFRARALDLLVEYGPPPTDESLIRLTSDKSPMVRAKAVTLLGRGSGELVRKAIVEALKDADPLVRRRACEAIVRSGVSVPADALLPLLDDPSRWIRYAARIAMEHGDPDQIAGVASKTSSHTAFNEAMLALVRTKTYSRVPMSAWLPKNRAFLLKTRTPEENLGFARVQSLMLQTPEGRPETDSETTKRTVQMKSQGASQRMYLKQEMKKPIPSRAMIVETTRILGGIGDEASLPLILELLAGEKDHATQVHFAICLRNIKTGWSSDQKRTYWEWFDRASTWEAGFSYLGYLDFMLQDFLSFATPEEKSAWFRESAKHPFPSRVLIRAIDLDAEPERIKVLPQLYADLAKSDNLIAASELRTLLLEKLGQAKRPEAHATLRELAKSDPARRDLIARALCNNTTSEDVAILVSALESRDPNTTSQVVGALIKLDAKPEGPEALRNLLRLAKRTGPPIVDSLNTLAKHWYDDIRIDPAPKDVAEAITFWSGIYAEKFPKGPPLEDSDGGSNSYSLPQLITGVLQSPARKNASAERGRLVIARAKCLECHKLGSEGQGLGPDLTTVASRFRPTEVLESIAEPSKVISDQYKPITVATTDGKIYNGMPTGRDEKNLVLLLSDGIKVTIPKDQIDEEKPSMVSVMPEGLLNTLSYQEIADILALLESQPKVEIPPK